MAARRPASMPNDYDYISMNFAVPTCLLNQAVTFCLSMLSTVKLLTLTNFSPVGPRESDLNECGDNRFSHSASDLTKPHMALHGPLPTVRYIYNSWMIGDANANT